MLAILKIIVILSASFDLLLAEGIYHRCLVCNSTEPGCGEGLEKFVGNCSLENDSCFTLVSEGMLIRGCSSQLASCGEREPCANEEGGACISCSENECNRNPWLKCSQCGDGMAHESCYDKPEARFCPQYRSKDRCYEIIHAAKDQEGPQLIRGCESTLEQTGYSCDQAVECKILSHCNIGLGHWIGQKASKSSSIECLRCTSQDDEACIQGTSKAQDCPQPTDKCFSRLHDGILQRNCLSTLPAEEQQMCSEDDSDSTCVACSDQPGCNTHHLLRCFQCNKSHSYCHDPNMTETLSATFCPRFQTSARCFARILKDEIERGCTTEEVCVGNNKCLTCSKDGCNSESETKLKEVLTCLRCSSQNGDNTDCELPEDHKQLSQECDQWNDVCFVRAKDSTIERNCLSTLSEEDQRKCNDEADATCDTCTGNDCNILPWLRCYRCSKSQDSRCTAPDTLGLQATFCDRFQHADFCYARIVDREQGVQRGCVADLIDETDACEDHSMCTVCDHDACNDVDEDTLSGYTRCVTCSTEDGEEKVCEQPNPSELAEACDEPADKCFTRVIGGHLERGCLSTLDLEEQTQCDDIVDATCNTCEDDSCNTERWLKCVKCKASINVDCESSELLELASYCSGHSTEGACYSRVVQGDLERGCTLELGDPERVCQDTEGCVKCSSENCNFHSKESLLGGIQCVQCGFESEEACDSQLAEPKACPQMVDQCYTRVADGKLTRNCLSTLDEQGREACSNPEDTSCIVCGESGCNSDRWISCHQCDTATNLRCAAEQLESDSSYCTGYDVDDKCYTKMVANRLKRGCLSDYDPGVDVCDGADVCDTCQEDACNKAPANALVHTTCQQCTSTDGPECALGTVESTSCPQRDDLCFTAVGVGMTLKRGCLSTLSGDLQRICRDVANTACIACANDGCNDLIWPKCYQCKSSTDESCDGNLSEVQLGFCPAYGNRVFCYASIVDGVVSRGCTSNAYSFCKDNNRCVTCNGPGCNTISKEMLDSVQTCYRCSSAEGSCDPSEGLSHECNKQSDGCYTKLAGGTLSRGCIAELNEEECQGDTVCLVCTGKDCNRHPWPKCYQCSNATDVECARKQGEGDRMHYCQKNTNKECFGMVEARTFTRGCASDLQDDQCQDQTNCVKCTGDGCNKHSLKSMFNPASCLRCHSDLRPGCLEGKLTPVACDDPDDLCFYRRTSAKSVHRGCLQELFPADQDRCRSTYSRSCHTCDEEGCNDVEWRACYQCSSITEPRCEFAQTDDTLLKLCEKVNDYCYEDRNELDVRRGCGYLFCADRKTCLECDQNGCNGHPESDLMPSLCLICDSNDPFCANGSGYEQYCNYIDEPCYSRVANDGTLHRGCFSHLFEPHKSQCMNADDHSCITCQGITCNRESWLQCLQCRSLELGHYCSREASPLKSHFCKRHKLNDRCFAKDAEGMVTRGCESDYEPTEAVCKNLTRKNCFLCEGDNCNDRSLNGVHSTHQLPFALYLYVMGLVIHFLVIA